MTPYDEPLPREPELESLARLSPHLPAQQARRVGRLIELLTEVRGLELPLVQVLTDLFHSSPTRAKQRNAFDQFKHVVTKAAEKNRIDVRLEVVSPGDLGAQRIRIASGVTAAQQKRWAEPAKGLSSARHRPEDYRESFAALDVYRPDLMELRRRFDELAAMCGRRAAGKLFELWFIDLCNEFDLRATPGSASRSEQNDVSIILDRMRYTVEVKWRGPRAGAAELGSHAHRLKGGLGFLVSATGFARTVVDSLTKGTAPAFFLMNDEDLRAVLDGDIALDVLVRAKAYAFTGPEKRVDLWAPELLSVKARNLLLQASSTPTVPFAAATIRALEASLRLPAEDLFCSDDRRLRIIRIDGELRVTIAVWQGEDDPGVVQQAIDASQINVDLLVADCAAVLPHNARFEESSSDRKLRHETAKRFIDGENDVDSHGAERALTKARRRSYFHAHSASEAARYLHTLRNVPGREAAAVHYEHYPTEAYSESSGQESSGATSPALPTVQSWLARADAPPLAVVLGDYGTGKTFLARMLARAGRVGGRGPLPFYVDLREVKLARLGDGTLLGLLRSYLPKLGMRGDEAEDLLAGNRAGHVALILDGFDEIAAKSTSSEARELWRELTIDCNAGARRLLTCRTHFFASGDDARRQIGSEQALLGRDAIDPGYAWLLHLLPFDQTQIRAFVEARLGPQRADEFLAVLGRVHDLGDLSTKPVLLNLIVQLEDRIRDVAAGNGNVTAGILYELVANAWLERDAEKHVLAPEEKLAIMGRIARTLWTGSTLVIAKKEIDTLARAYLVAEHGSSTPEQVQRVASDLRSAAFLSRDDRDGFRFQHRSLFEFFLASELVNNLRTGDMGHVTQQLGMARVAREVVDFAVDLLTARDLSDHFEETLWAILKAASNDEGIRKAKANAAVLMAGIAGRRGTLPRPRRGPIDLRGVSLVGAYLRGLSFQGADLSGASFEGATLDTCDFASAALDKTSFAFATLDDASFRRAHGDSPDFFQARCRRADFGEANLAQADFFKAGLKGASLAGAILPRARLIAADLRDIDGRALTLDGADARGARLTRAVLATETLDAVVVSPERLLGLAQRSSRHSGPLCALTGPLGHKGVLNFLAFASDGKTIATTSGDGSARLWDAATGSARHILKGHTDTVTHLAFAPNGKTIATASGDGSARLWDADTGRPLHVLEGHAKCVNHLAFAPDGKTIATASDDHSIRLWDAVTGRTRRVLEGHAYTVTHLAFAPDGLMIATASGDRTARLWDAATGRLLRVLKGHKGWITHLAFAHDGKTIATASADRTARLWDAATGRSLHVFKGHTGSVTYVEFALGAGMIATASADHTARLWDAATGRVRRVLVGHTDWIRHLKFAPDGKTIATASDDHTARVWDATTGRALHVLEGHTGWIYHLSFAPDGNSIATASGDESARLWDSATGRALQVFESQTDWTIHLAFAPGGRTMATASIDGTARLWDSATGRSLRVLKGHRGLITHLAFARDGKTIGTASADHTARLWSAATGRPLHVLEGHTGTVTRVAFARDGGTIATASVDNTARLWDAATGRVLHVLEGHTNWIRHLTFVAGGKTIATLADQTVRVWDATTGRTLHVFDLSAGFTHHLAFAPHGRTIATAAFMDRNVGVVDAITGRALFVLKGHTGQVNRLGFAPDGRTIATASADGTARLWDAVKGRKLFVLKGHTDEVTDLAFAPDGGTIATASNDGTARVWDVATGRALHVLEGHVDPVTHVAFASDGKSLATSSGDRMTRLWQPVPATARSSWRARGIRCIWALFCDGERGWFSYDDKGRHQGDEDCLERLLYEDTSLALEQRLRYHAPDLPEMRLRPNSVNTTSTE